MDGEGKSGIRPSVAVVTADELGGEMGGIGGAPTIAAGDQLVTGEQGRRERIGRSGHLRFEDSQTLQRTHSIREVALEKARFACDL